MRVAGGLVAALVATGVTVALDDDTSPSVDRPVRHPGHHERRRARHPGRSSPRCSRRSWPSRRAARPREGLFEGAGSGIVLSADGLVLTNAHVIGSIGDITVVLPDGSEHPATLVGASPDDDVALIQVEDVDDLVPAELGSSDDLQVGDEVIAIGNALNLGGEPTVTRGHRVGQGPRPQRRGRHARGPHPDRRRHQPRQLRRTARQRRRPGRRR